MASTVKTVSPSLEQIAELELLGIAPESYAFRPHDFLRKLIARRMLESVQAAPHFSVTMRIELDALLALRERFNSSSAIRASVNDLMIKASALALKECPAINSSFTNEGMITHHHADISFAVSFDGGLVTPIIRQAELKSLADIAAETKDLADRGRRKRLRPEEYSGGSFTVSNLGMFGVSTFDAIINQPQAAILSVGGPERQYVFDRDAPRIATCFNATLTSDHRAIDGTTAAAWLKSLKEKIEVPDLLADA